MILRGKHSFLYWITLLKWNIKTQFSKNACKNKKYLTYFLKLNYWAADVYVESSIEVFESVIPHQQDQCTWHEAVKKDMLNMLKGKRKIWQYFWENDTQIGPQSRGVVNDANGVICRAKGILLFCSWINDDCRLSLQFQFCYLLQFHLNFGKGAAC